VQLLPRFSKLLTQHQGGLVIFYGKQLSCKIKVNGNKQWL
jgi:hypothetical protein